MQNWERSRRAARERAIKEAEKDLDNEVHVLLQEIEFDQALVHRDVTKLYTLLGQYRGLEKRWREFQKQGGITADDYRDFLRNRFAPRKMIQKEHLRLLVTNTQSKSKSLPRKRLNPTGNDAA